MGESVIVPSLPDCDFCQLEDVKRVARYDGKTTLGPWANMCDDHFLENGIGVGTGKGQRLILAD